jgi:demethylsterigmatocystin 6-O-methyltransferase
VDVGGGKGQQCAALLQKNANLNGRIILQDLPTVVAGAITDDRVERMGHDFFTEQPIKGIMKALYQKVLVAC